MNGLVVSKGFIRHISVALVASFLASVSFAQFDPATAITDATTAVTNFGGLLVPLVGAMAALAVGYRLVRRYVGG